MRCPREAEDELSELPFYARGSVIRPLNQGQITTHSTRAQIGQYLFRMEGERMLKNLVFISDLVRLTTLTLAKFSVIKT